MATRCRCPRSPAEAIAHPSAAKLLRTTRETRLEWNSMRLAAVSLRCAAVVVTKCASPCWAFAEEFFPSDASKRKQTKGFLWEAWCSKKLHHSLQQPSFVSRHGWHASNQKSGKLQKGTRAWLGALANATTTTTTTTTTTATTTTTTTNYYY